MPQIPGSRRIIPPSPTEAMVANLGRLLEQDEVWVGRARWPRWLSDGQLSDAMPIADMLHDEKLAARAWLRQQRHALFRTLDGGSRSAPDGWIEDRPLFRGLSG